MPFLVMTGMHYSLLPAYVNSLSMLGYETVIRPGNLPSNIAQGAAALCVAIKTKNKNFRQLAVSGGVTALLGVTEPALFGVNVRLRKPLIATTIGGGLGGLYAGWTGVRPVSYTHLGELLSIYRFGPIKLPLRGSWHAVRRD